MKRKFSDVFIENVGSLNQAITSRLRYCSNLLQIYPILSFEEQKAVYFIVVKETLELDSLLNSLKQELFFCNLNIHETEIKKPLIENVESIVNYRLWSTYGFSDEQILAIALSSFGREKLMVIKKYESQIAILAEARQQESIVKSFINLPRNKFSEKKISNSLKKITAFLHPADKSRDDRIRNEQSPKQ